MLGNLEQSPQFDRARPTLQSHEVSNQGLRIYFGMAVL